MIGGCERTIEIDEAYVGQDARHGASFGPNRHRKRCTVGARARPGDPERAEVLAPPNGPPRRQQPGGLGARYHHGVRQQSSKRTSTSMSSGLTTGLYPLFAFTTCPRHHRKRRVGDVRRIVRRSVTPLELGGEVLMADRSYRCGKDKR
jgi:hypothetical protein